MNIWRLSLVHCQMAGPIIHCNSQSAITLTNEHSLDQQVDPCSHEGNAFATPKMLPFSWENMASKVVSHCLPQCFGKIWLLRWFPNALIPQYLR
jgi:hypothetical protein